MTKHFCDRCQTELKVNGFMHTDTGWDLCVVCYDKWIETIRLFLGGRSAKASTSKVWKRS